MNTPKNKKNAPSTESGNKRPKRTRDKLVHLNDLIPEQGVRGGRQLPFGVIDEIQTNEKENRSGTAKESQEKDQSCAVSSNLARQFLD